MWDDTQLNETSEIDDRITTDLDLSAISKNFDIRVKGESSEHSLQSYENTEDAAEELRAKKLEKQSKKKLKHNNLENIGWTMEQGNFEDDEISPKKRKKRNLNFETSAVQKPKDSKLLLQYILKNKNLKPIKSKLAGDSFLTEDDDIWIMKGPSEIDIKSLYDRNLVIDNKCKLKINNQVYQGILNNSKINVAMPYIDGEKFIIKKFLPEGLVRLRKRIPKPHFVQDAVLDMNPHPIPLPETKLRHPLFGSNYKSYVKLPSYVTEKLQNLESTSVENHNIKKKKKRKKIEVEVEPVRKSKKRKFSGESDTTVVKAKKKKHKVSIEEMWEKVLDEHLFNL